MFYFVKLERGERSGVADSTPCWNSRPPGQVPLGFDVQLFSPNFLGNSVRIEPQATAA